MTKLERPANQGDDVQHGARPKNENDKQSGEHIGPVDEFQIDKDRVRVLDQNRERDALNNADEG